MREGVRRYVAGRVLAIVPVWLGVSLLAFALANLAPGDPAEIILQRQSGEPPSSADVERLRSRLGLDDPLPVRYAHWMAGALRGDLGVSFSSGTPVFEKLATNFPATLRLSVAALMISIAIALPLGIAAAVARGSVIDHVSRTLALIAASIPTFVLGYFLVLVFAVRLHWLPVAGAGDFRHFILPAITLGVTESAALIRLMRISMLGVLFEDYVRSARAKGLSEFRVVARHALRNALNPLVTLTGVRFGKLMGGAMIVEILFARPGLGRTMVEAIFDRDYPTIQGFTLFAGTLFLIVNLVVDVSYAWMDPRVQLGPPRRANA